MRLATVHNQGFIQIEGMEQTWADLGLLGLSQAPDRGGAVQADDAERVAYITAHGDF